MQIYRLNNWISRLSKDISSYDDALHNANKFEHNLL